MNILDKKQVETRKNLAYIASRFISRGIPLISIFWIYGLFQDVEPSTRVTGASIIGVGVVVLLFYKDLKLKAEELVESQWKHAIQEGRIFVVFLVVLLFIQWAKSGILEIEKLVFILTLCNGVAIYPTSLHKKYLDLSKTYEQKEKDTL